MVPVVLADAAQAATSVFINELHYDNASTDAGEAIEVAGPAGTDLTGWTIVLYNGNGGAPYDTDLLPTPIPSQAGGYGTVAINYPTNGIQNGAPDGMALVDDSGAVIQFLSYEGTFTAVGGPADGLLSTDIGVSESSSTPAGTSLQLTGTGTTYGDFTWAPSAPNTFGAPNTGQTFGDEPPPTGSDTLVVNEIDYDQPSTDDAEFVELYNVSSSSIDLAGWYVELVNGDGGGATVYDTITLPTVTLGAGDYYVVCADATMTAECDLEDISSIQNGAPDAVALFDGSATLIDTVSYEGDTGAPYTEGSGNGLFDSGSTAYVGISRVPNGTDTNQNNVDLLSVRCITPGAENSASGTDCVPPPVECLPVPVLISVVQGDGASTPCDGVTVTIEGVVVGDYEGPSPNLRGFYVEEEDTDHDGDPATSEGIFVFNFDNNDVSLGDQVSVTGTAGEFQGQTQIGFPQNLSVLDTGQGDLVTPAVAALPVPAGDHYERFEGMSVTYAQTLFVTEHYQLGRFGQVVVSSDDRLYQPTNVVAPGAPANAVQATNDLNRVIVDDALNNQNPDPIIYGRDGNELTASNTLRGGDTLTGATGVMTYTWAGNSASGAAYRLRPQSPDVNDIVFAAANPRPASAPEVGGNLTVVSFNVLNYFLTLDDGPDICGPNEDQECRGADSTLEFERQRTKLLASLEQLDADVLGLVELENTPDVSPEQDLADGLTADYAVVEVGGEGLVGDDTIRVGIIYKPGAVTPVGDPAILDFALDPLGESRNRSALAQTFAENATGEVFTVVVNHFKSKSGSEIDNSGGVCATTPAYPDCDQGDGQAYFNATRTSAAQQLVDWLATTPTSVGDPDVMILGDLNAYAMEDPISLLEGAGYLNLHTAFGSRYSYVFDGQWGFLDYALASASMAAQVTGAADYHINSDEPNVLDYNTNFQSPDQIVKLYAPDEYRTSDHDPVVVGLALDAIDATVTATPDTLWPPNHKYREVLVSATDAGVDLEVLITRATSSEPDSGINDEDVPNDIVITGDDTVDLRAERDDEGPGRTYTITSFATNAAGQVQLARNYVVVPHDRRSRRI
jgi:predicted extracellular nuclease